MSKRVVIVGRPNVGKSTLFNRIIGQRTAIVEEKPGVTRDRKESKADWAGIDFDLVDTGGWMASGDELERKVSSQSAAALKDADVILFVVDAEVGLTVDDETVAELLRPSSSKVVLVANKSDNLEKELDTWQFLSFGFGDAIPIGASHGRNVGDLLDVVISKLPEEASQDLESIVPTEDDARTSIVIVGRPNVGKSTLFNKIIGEERSIVHDMPGTTRDVIDTVVETPAGMVKILDTAGLRRKTRVDEGAEYYSTLRALSAVDRANIALYVIDAAEGITNQDQRLIERVDAAGCPIVIVINKIDLTNAEQRAKLTDQRETDLGFLGYAPVVKMSALTGKGFLGIWPAIEQAIDGYGKRVPTRELNKVVMAAQSAHASPAGKIMYATQGTTDPPTITLFSNKTIPKPYLRYLEKQIREHFGFEGTPIKMRVRQRS